MSLSLSRPLGSLCSLPPSHCARSPRDWGQVGNAGPEAGSAPQLVIYVTRANVSLPRARQAGRTELRQSVSSSVLPSPCQNRTTRSLHPSGSLPGRPFLQKSLRLSPLPSPDAHVTPSAWGLWPPKLKLPTASSSPLTYFVPPSTLVSPYHLASSGMLHIFLFMSLPSAPTL